MPDGESRTLHFVGVQVPASFRFQHRPAQNTSKAPPPENIRNSGTVQRPVPQPQPLAAAVASDVLCWEENVGQEMNTFFDVVDVA